MPNSTQDSEIILLTQKLAEHEKRIVALERSIVALERRIAISDDETFVDSNGIGSGYYGDDDSEPILATPVPAKRGRRPRIQPEEFAHRRDRLVQFIEIRWPQLVNGLNRRKSAKSFLKTLADASPGAEAAWPYQQLKGHVHALQEFMRSGRYRGEPRQLAYAMAGLPELSWRSSLDYGTKHPSSLRICLPTFADHIRRHNPRCLEAFEREGVNEVTVKLLRPCCEDCRKLSWKANRVRDALKFR